MVSSLKLSGAYKLLRESGIVKLPSDWTLHDYMYFVPPKAGFQGDVESQLVKDAMQDLSHWMIEKFVIIVFDEMKIKERLIFDKYNDQLVGFVTLYNVSNCLMDLERKCSSSALAVTIATHMLVLMVRGVTIHLYFPFAQFPTDDITAYQLYPLVTVQYCN